jgi:hypothetical protein
VYFVNGVAKTLEKAREQATELSKKIDAPVGLIYNPSILTGDTGTPDSILYTVQKMVEMFVPISPYIAKVLVDFEESFYDRAWPGLFPHGCKTQFNPTAKQITGLLYNKAEETASQPITIVSHSQGNLIVRNGILGAMHLGKQAWISQNLTWIIAAPPLNAAEIAPAVHKQSLTLLHPEDCIALIKDGTIHRTCDPSFEKHDFIETYLPMLEPHKALITYRDIASDYRHAIDTLYLDIWQQSPPLEEDDKEYYISVLSTGQTLAEVRHHMATLYLQRVILPALIATSVLQ